MGDSPGLVPAPAIKRLRIVNALIETFGFSPAVATAVALILGLATLLAVIWVVQSAPPRVVYLSAGPEGSSFRQYADRYRKIMQERGVSLEILNSEGSLDNLKKLQLQSPQVDVAFVQGGLPKDTDLRGMVSLGSIAYQPLLVLYQLPTPISRLSELGGRRLAVGREGSGTRALAVQLLAANGVVAPATTFVDLDSEAAAKALLAGNVDAVFLMGDSAPVQTLRNLVRTPGVQIFHFAQADAYVRRYPFLNKMILPQGAIDLGRNLPANEVVLVGPTVELVARKGLNSALSDLLLEVAGEVHGNAGLLQRRGEFPAPLEHEFTLSADALRYYKSGKSFLHRNVQSFWLASLLNRILVAIVPLILLLIPALRLFPVIYRWSIQLRIFRCYRPLLRLERDAMGPLTSERVEELMTRLDEIEGNVDQLKVPASFADQFYILRGHVAFVRQKLMHQREKLGA